MKEVGDKFGAGELILPFVLQSAEVMKKAVARLETYLEKTEGQTKGKVVLATVYGDVHDIGKNLVNTILTNNGYTVYDLGKQVPVNTIIEKAEEVGADAIGLSRAAGLDVQADAALRAGAAQARAELPAAGGRRGDQPELRALGGADRSPRADAYPPGMFYCKDAFEGLAVMDRLVDADDARRASSARTTRRWCERAARSTRRTRRRRRRCARLRARSAVVPDADVPKPPFWG